jgi:hypothetical protein
MHCPCKLNKNNDKTTTSKCTWTGNWQLATEDKGTSMTAQVHHLACCQHGALLVLNVRKGICGSSLQFVELLLVLDYGAQACCHMLHRRRGQHGKNCDLHTTDHVIAWPIAGDGATWDVEEVLQCNLALLELVTCWDWP